MMIYSHIKGEKKMIDTTIEQNNSQIYPVEDTGKYISKKINNTTIIKLFTEKRTSARKKSNMKMEIIVDDDEEKFIDSLFLKSSLTFSAFKLLEQAKILENDSLEIGQIAEIIDIFPEFMLKITKKANFDVNEEEFDDFDDMIKIGIFEVLFKHYEKMEEVISKK